MFWQLEKSIAHGFEGMYQHAYFIAMTLPLPIIIMEIVVLSKLSYIINRNSLY